MQIFHLKFCLKSRISAVKQSHASRRYLVIPRCSSGPSSLLSISKLVKNNNCMQYSEVECTGCHIGNLIQEIKDVFRLKTAVTTFLTVFYQKKDFHHLKQIY